MRKGGEEKRPKFHAFMGCQGQPFPSIPTWRGYLSMQIVAQVALLWLTFIFIALFEIILLSPLIPSMFIGFSLQVFLSLPSSWMTCKLFFFTLYHLNSCIFKIAFLLLLLLYLLLLFFIFNIVALDSLPEDPS